MAKSARRFSASFNEQVWQTETDPVVLIDGIGALIRDGWSHLTKRQIRSFMFALARSVEHSLPTEEWKQAITRAERRADGEELTEEVYASHYNLSFQHSDPSGPPYTEHWNQGCAENVVLLSLQSNNRSSKMKSAAGWAASALLDRQLLNAPNSTIHIEHATRVSRQQQVRFLHDIFRNPFRKLKFERTTWRTDTAVAIAREMYESRDFGAMPILADALQDAGCDDTDILSHCREPNATHVRGCWVVDLVLGKS